MRGHTARSHTEQPAKQRDQHCEITHKGACVQTRRAFCHVCVSFLCVTLCVRARNLHRFSCCVFRRRSPGVVDCHVGADHCERVRELRHDHLENERHTCRNKQCENGRVRFVHREDLSPFCCHACTRPKWYVSFVNALSTFFMTNASVDLRVL